MEYPTFLYRCPGPHFGPQWTTYDTRDVAREADLPAALADGWCKTLQEAAAQYLATRDAAAAAQAAKTKSPGAQPIPAPEQAPAPAPAEAPDADDEDAPPTRAEMLEQAARIGLRVDRRWSDARLLSAIIAKMKEQAP